MEEPCGEGKQCFPGGAVVRVVHADPAVTWGDGRAGAKERLNVVVPSEQLIDDRPRKGQKKHLSKHQRSRRLLKI